MKNDLTCGVAGDLLPSYAENLLSEESRQAVERHLRDCPSCAEKLRAMTAPAESPAETEAREVDYLKRIKRKNRLRVFLAALCAAAVILLGFAAKIFLIGTPAQTQDCNLALSTITEENHLVLVAHTPNSGEALFGWEEDHSGGVVSITARRALVSPFHKSGDMRLEIPLEGVKEVSLCGELLYQDGLLIDSAVVDVYEAQTPYAGDAPALGRLAEIFQLESLAPYTMELFTSQEPYRWTLHFRKPSSADGLICLDMSCKKAPLFLALAGNLSEVGWTYTDKDGNTHDHVLTLEEANARLPELTALYNEANGTDWPVKDSVKDYAAAPADLQRLIELLRYDFSLCLHESTEERYASREFGKGPPNVSPDGRCLNLHRSHS